MEPPLNQDERLKKAYDRFVSRGSRVTASDAASKLNVKEKKYDSMTTSAKQNKRKIVWCLLLSITLLLIAIAFFTATACVSLRAILDKTHREIADDSNRTEDLTMSLDSQESFLIHPGSLATSRTSNPSSTVSKQIRINNSSGWAEAARNIISSIDFDADPCEDFYQYACGIWPLKNPLSANQSTRTIYTTVTRRVSEQIRQAIQSLDTDPDQWSTAPRALRNVKLAYDACIDLDRMTAEGPLSLLKLLDDRNNGIGKWPLITSIIGGDQSDRSIFGHSRFDQTIRKIDTDQSISTTTSSDQLRLIKRSLDFQYPNFARTIGILKNRYGIDTVIFTYVGSDEGRSSDNVLQLSAFMLPLGLGLFKAPYYLNDNKHGRIMAAYSELITTVGNLLLRDSGLGNVTVNGSHVHELVNFERQLAAYVHKTESNFHRKWTLQKLIKEVPMFDWHTFFESLLPQSLHGLLEGERLRLDVPSKRFLLNVVSLLNRTDPMVVQNYLIWRLVKYSLPYLGQEYRDALQKLNSVVSGQKKSTAVWESCIDYVQGRYDMPGLGYATGRIFIDRSFSPEAKNDVELMVASIVDSFQSIINNLDWMDYATKQIAADKARSMTTHVAYPDWIKDNDRLNDYYANFSINSHDSMFLINLKFRSWSVNKNQLQLLIASDRKDFGGPPSATNAWYSVNHNALTVPAGELQPPFYKSTYPLAIKYGAAGSVIGHEMMHGFDSQGSRYDAQGRVRRWWTEESMDEFEDRTRCLEREYSRFCYPEIDDRLCVDGEHTIGENTADLGGLKAAYLAYRKLSKHREEPAPLLPGPAMAFTHDQLFFLSFASFWCGSSTEAATRDQLITNHHTPAKFRVIGTLRNTPSFASAFQCPLGSYMNPREKCDIW